MATTMKWGETITVLMELGFETQFFTLDNATLGQLDTGGYLDGTLLGDDVSAYCQNISINRGRPDQLQNFNAGTCSITLNNNDRRFDPINESSPYWNATLGRSGVTPRRKVTVLSNGVPIFTGRITDVNVDYQPTRPSATVDNSTVQITAADDFVILANTAIQTEITPTEELSGTRLNAILDLPEVGYSATSRNISAGTVALGGGATYVISPNTNVLTYLQAIGASEQGSLFISADGKVTFTDRVTTAFASISATFSDTGANIPYQKLAVLYGQELLYNKVICTVINGIDQVANDTTSQTEFGVSTFSLSNLLLSEDSAALTLAESLLARYKQPKYRFDKIQSIYNGLSTPNQNALTGLELADTVRITRTYPTGTPLTVTKEYSVEAVRHSITLNEHIVEYSLAVAEIVYPFILAGYPPTTRINLMPNPSAEGAFTGWSSSGGTLTQSSTYAYAGTYSARTQTVTDGTVDVNTGTFSMVAGQTYTGSAYVRSSVSRQCRVYIGWYNGGTFLSNSVGSYSTSTTGGWTRCTVTGTAPATATIGYLVTQVASTVIGDLHYWDAFLIEQASSALPYFDGTYADTYTGYALDTKAWTGTANASTSYGYWYQGATRTNLLANPNIEVSAAQWTNIGALSTVTRSATDGAVSGTASLKVVRATNSGTAVNTGAWAGLSTVNYAPITPSTTYTISVYVRKISGTDPTMFCSIAWYTAAGAYISETTPVTTLITSTTNWVRLSATGTAPANAAFANPLVRENAVNGQLASTWQADAFLLELGAVVLPYFDGAGTAPYTGYTLTSIGWNGTANASTSTASWGLDTAYVGTPMDSDYALS